MLGMHRVRSAAARLQTGAGQSGRAALVLVSYALLSLLVFTPMLRQFATALLTGPYGYEDSWQNVWMLWWAQHALSHGQNPFFTTMLYYPTGVGLFWQTLGITNGILAFPLTTAVNAIASYNTIAMLSFILSGYTMYLLAYRVVGSPTGAWLAGLLFAFSPYHVSKLSEGQLELLSLEYLPLFALWLIKGLDEGQRKYIGLSGLLLAWITLTSLYYSFFSLLYLGLYAALLLFRRRSWASLRQLLVGGVVILLPLVILLAPLIGDGTGGDPPGWQERQILHSATPLDFVSPGPYGPLWGAWAEQLRAQLHPQLQVGVTITSGLIALLLAVAGLALAGRRAWPWGALAAGIMLLALGPALVLNGHVTAIRLPYALLDYLPTAKSGQRPNHIAAYSTMLLALLAAFGWAAIQPRLPGAARRLALAAVLAGMAADLWPTGLVASTLVTSPFYATIPPASHGAVLDLPFQPDSSDSLRAQLIHQRPILGAYLARIPDYAFADDTDGISQLWQNDLARQSLLYPDWTAALTPTLGTYDIEYVVLHLNVPNPQSYRALRDSLDTLLERVYQDTRLIAYRRPANAPRPPLIALSNASWYPLERNGQQRWQWIGPTAMITLVNPLQSTRLFELDFTVGAYKQNRTAAIEQQINGRWDKIAQINVAALPGQRHYRLLLNLPPGRSQLRFASDSTRSDEQLPRELSIVFTRLALRQVGQ